MKLMVIRFPDSVNTSVLPVGTEPVTVSDGTNTVAGGEILALTVILEPVHVHTVPSGETGPQIIT